MKWKVNEQKDLGELGNKVRSTYADCWGCHNDCYDLDFHFDILIDASTFTAPSGPNAQHLGHHVDNLELVIDNPGFEAWWGDFTYQYRFHTTQDIVNVLVVCPMGNQRSVSCAEILRYLLKVSGKLVDKELRHISHDKWGEHGKKCMSCQYPYNQPRFKEVLQKALQKVC